MTAATLVPSILAASGHALTWTRYDDKQPTSDQCPVTWCDGECDQSVYQDVNGTEHFHDIACGSVDGETVLQVAVAQWRPYKRGMLVDSGDSFRVLRPCAPHVDVYVSPDGGPGRALLFEESGYVESFAAVLRTIGHEDFADVMTTAADQLRAIQKGGRR